MKTRSAHRLLLSLASGALIFSAVPLAGCGDDQPTTNQRGARRKGARGKKAKAGGAAAAAAAAAAEGQGGPVAGRKLRGIDWNARTDLDELVQQTRDPFQIYVEEITPPITTTRPNPRLPKLEGPLAEYTVNSLKLVAIITGSPLPKAMVQDPKGEGHVVRVGDIIGKDRPMRLVRIRRNALVFQPLVGLEEGKPVEPVIVTLWTDEEAQELLR